VRETHIVALQRREVLSSEEQFLNGLRRELLRRRCFLISPW
jgi:hypothetical protein